MYLFLLLKKIEVKEKKERRQLGMIVYIWSRWFVPDSHLHLLCRALVQENIPLQSLHILFHSKLEYYSLLTKPEKILRNYFACGLRHFSHVWLFETLQTVACDSSVHGSLQARRLEGVATPYSRGSLIQLTSPETPALQADSLPLSHWGKPQEMTLRRTTTTKIRTSKILVSKFLGRRTGNRLFCRFLIPLKDFCWALSNKVLYTIDKLINNNITMI